MHADCPPLKLPLSALEWADACYLDRRTAAFRAHHGHPPGEDSTWTQWCAVLPSIAHRLWTVARVLPLVYPAQRRGLLLAVVEVGYRAALRAQPADSDPDPRAAEALALVRRWLDGEPIPASALRTLCGYRAATYPTYAVCYVAYAAAEAAAAAAEAAEVAGADIVSKAAVFATNAAVFTAEAVYRCAAYVADDESAERALQVQDLDELLVALRLEVT